MKENFCQKEQILVNAIASVESLTKELADLKQSKIVGTSDQSSYKNELMEQILVWFVYFPCIIIITIYFENVHFF